MSFFERILGRGAHKGSGTTAKERLQFILVHDRINLPPERLQQMKEEILAVISKYVSVNPEDVDIALQKRQRDSLIVAEIPFTKPAEGIERDDPEAEQGSAPTNSSKFDESPKSIFDPDDDE